ncbi:MAG: hypothetical protein WD009_07700 [Phycisphaeraceae bacterium]
MAARTLQQIDAGELDAAAEGVITLKRLARHLTRQHTVIEHLVAVSLVALARTPTAHLAGHPDLTAEQARAFIARLDALKPAHDASRALDIGERFIALDAIHALARGEAEALEDELPIAVHGFDVTIASREMNAWIDELVAIARKPTIRERRAALQAWEASRDERFEIFDRENREARHRFLAEHRDATPVERKTAIIVPLLMWSFGALESAMYPMDTGWYGEQLDRVAFALAGHRAETGSYPESLDELVPAWLEVVPEDPYAHEPGTPIVYRLEDDRVIIYSVGRNGEDDGGVDYPSDLAIEWPR